MDYNWKGEIHNLFIEGWGWILCVPMVWFPLRAAYSFTLSDQERLSFDALARPIAISLGIAVACPIAGFFTGWAILAVGSIFSGKNIYVSDAAKTVVRAVWISSLLYCVGALLVLTARH